MPCGRRGLLWLAAVTAVICPAGGDVIFRVPEVLVRHAAAQKSVGTGRANANATPKASANASPKASANASPKANDTDSWNGDDGGILEVRYEEYFVEHDVSTADARQAATELKLNEVPPTRIGCGSCSRRELEYCETRLLADHCCCERRFFPEPFPWLPHTCYMGAGRCKPLAQDCARYARLRDCCCYRKLAERWKSILSSSTRLEGGGISLLLLSVLLFVTYQ